MDQNTAKVLASKVPAPKQWLDTAKLEVFIYILITNII